MVYIEKSKDIINNNKKYTVFELSYKNNKVPIIVDKKYYSYLKNLNKSWYINENGFVITTHKIDDDNSIDINLHEIIMALHIQENKLEKKDYPILHINRIGIDNRIENLIYDMPDKNLTKNTKKKKRIIELPKESGIKPSEIPTYIWYLKPSDSHGERFIIKIGENSWKTTSSNKYSLRYKLEEAKKYLRDLKDNDPLLFEENCMNGEFNKEGKHQLKIFYSIIDKAKYNNINKIYTDNLTDYYLKENLNGLSKIEKDMIRNK